SYNSELLCISCSDGTCQFADPTQGSIVRQLPQKETNFARGLFSPYGPFFLSVTKNGLFSRWDAISFKKQNEEVTPIRDVDRCAASPSTPSFALRSATGLVVAWDYLDNSVVEIRTPPGRVTPICYSATGDSLLIGYFGSSVRSVSLARKGDAECAN